MKIAIPTLNQMIAPCFEAAKSFHIAIINKGKVELTESVTSSSREEFMNVRILRLHEVHTLICNGIKRFYLDQLTSMGINVIPNVNDSIQNAVERFNKGELTTYHDNVFENCTNVVISHEELVYWARNLFENAGYKVTVFFEEEDFMIDLVAEINCPVCKKNIEVAVCCGAQTYRAV
ncbi:MAG: NifB/NifX family molybdenum-iron cluster-binding protein, partial [Ignavibacteria bacterium]